MPDPTPGAGPTREDWIGKVRTAAGALDGFSDRSENKAAIVRLQELAEACRWAASRLTVEDPAALPSASAPAVTPELADAAKLLTLLGHPCPPNAQGDDHDWYECPRCEMVHELEMRGSLARRLLLTAAAALGGPNG